MFDFSIVTQWIDAFLREYMPEWGALLIEFVLIGVALLLLYALIALALIYGERKICAFFQCRLGPNRVGPFGIFQSVADMVKILIKELITIKRSDQFLSILLLIWLYLLRCLRSVVCLSGADCKSSISI